tara:strand:- start:2158 stop:3150 length:993 start_codon:yes stop_codon:yes gene_type:complete
MAFSYRDSGSFTSAAAVAFHDVVLPHGAPEKFVLKNRTAWGDDAAETSVESTRYKGMAEEAFQSIDQAVTTGIMSTEAGTTNGFRFFDTANPPVFAALAQTNISLADPGVVTMASTGSIQVGSVVRLDNTTGQLQTSGYDIEVTAVSTDTNITLNLDTQNFAAVGTAGNVRLLIPGRMFPRYRYIVPLANAVGITQATSAVVSMSVTHDFSVGEKVSLRVPSAYGMLEANNKSAIVTAVGTYTVTLDLDTSGFTAFLPPTSAVYAAGVSPATIVPAGAGPESGANPPGVPVTAAFDNRNRFVMRCGTNVVTSASAVYDWEALYSDDHNAE